jgi:predicted lipoprotein with Yx(FWY)xxD motif
MKGMEGMKKALPIGIVVIVIIVAIVAVVMHGNKKSPASTATKASNTSVSISNAVFKSKTSGSLGTYLVTPSGQPLYTYMKDTKGVSNCTGSCLTAWPAYQETSTSASLPSGVSTIKRTDNGEMQFTYNGLPLYTFASDAAGSAPAGNNVSDFMLAAPSGSSDSMTSTTSKSKTQSNTAGSYSGTSYNYGN